MDKETEQYFNEYTDLFRLPGWRTFQKEIAAQIELENTVEAVTDANDLFARKGKLQVLRMLSNLEATVETAYEHYKSGDTDEG